MVFRSVHTTNRRHVQIQLTSVCVLRLVENPLFYHFLVWSNVVFHEALGMTWRTYS